jgi:hypothetical protein
MLNNETCRVSDNNKRQERERERKYFNSLIAM